MKYSEYCIEASSSLLKFEFQSEGPKGNIKKQIMFKAFDNNPIVFNLGFGDVDQNGNVNNMVISDNSDSQKVLATVALTIYKFYERHPDCYVFITGSTPSRTRLYRIGIGNNLAKIRNDFYVFGLVEESVWELFEKGRNYNAFLIKLKNRTFTFSHEKDS